MASDALPAIVLPPQSTLLYQKLASYGELRQERVHHGAQENVLQKRGSVFGLTWVSNDKGNFLLACTSSGELVVWEVAPEVASAESLDTHSEVVEPLFRYVIFQNTRLHCLHMQFHVFIYSFPLNVVLISNGYIYIHIYLLRVQNLGEPSVKASCIPSKVFMCYARTIFSPVVMMVF